MPVARGSCHGRRNWVSVVLPPAIHNTHALSHNTDGIVAYSNLSHHVFNRRSAGERIPVNAAPTPDVAVGIDGTKSASDLPTSSRDPSMALPVHR